MRSISIQVQPHRAPGIDMAHITEAFSALASSSELVERHAFSSGEDGVPYFNYTFGTSHAPELWQLIQGSFYKSSEFASHMSRSSMAMCTGKDGWNDYLLLFHFDPKEKTEEISAL